MAINESLQVALILYSCAHPRSVWDDFYYKCYLNPEMLSDISRESLEIIFFN